MKIEDKIEKEILKGISNRIKSQRKLLGYTQAQFSELIDVPFSTYTKIENAILVPSLSILIKISEQFKLSLDYIVFGKESDNLPASDIYSLITYFENFVDTEKLNHSKDVLSALINALESVKK